MNQRGKLSNVYSTYAMTKISSFLVVVLLTVSCSRNITSGNASDKEKITEYEESLEGVRPKVAWEKVEELEVVPALEDNSFLPTEPKNDNVRIQEALTKIVAYNASITEMQGYRLQIFSGNSRGDFESTKSYILQYFPELEIYESYSQPTYKIKVGDFLKKMDAERYYGSIVNRFSSAKIIMDNIDVQKSLKIN